MSSLLHQKIPSRLKGAQLVQAILHGTTSPRPVCSQCRVRETDVLPQKMLRCTRCKVAHYCSGTCQKKHFSLHKHSCKYIAELRAEANEEKSDGHHSVLLSKLGDELVRMGYRETDTIENGSAYYRQALIHYIQMLPLMKEQEFFHTMEDRILLLLVLLGGDEATLQNWMQKSGSPRTKYYQEPLRPPMEGILDAPFLMLAKVLVGMRKLACSRQENSDEEETQATSKKDIQEAIQVLRSMGKGDYLVHLRDSIPLDPGDAPELFQGEVLREFWLLFQDSFFLTPGLNSVLHEFVPEEEYCIL